MTTLIHLPNLRDGYLALVHHVTHYGEQVSPRGIPTLEVQDVTFTVDDVSDTLPIGIGRDVNLRIAAIEALQLISGSSQPGLTVAASPTFQNFMEDDWHFHGAYGDRISDQFDHALRKLKSNPDTRQAVITLWSPTLDNQTGKKDYPCTVALGFRLRHDRLHLSVLMRSNDVWLGTAYDVFQFTQLQWTLAHKLGVEPGTYTHTAWSLHVYERDLARCALLHDPQSDRPQLPHGVHDYRDFGLDARDVALVLMLSPSEFVEFADNTSEGWYRQQLLRVHETRRQQLLETRGRELDP